MFFPSGDQAMSPSLPSVSVSFLGAPPLAATV